MAKKPAKKPAKKKAPAPKKKAVVKKPVKKVMAKPAAAKKAAPVKKGKAPAVKPAKKVELKKAAAPKGKAPVPPKVVEKLAKKGKAKAAAVEAEVEAAVPVEEETVEEPILTDAEGRRFCRVRDCDQLAVVDTYCRYHYLLHWKKIQVRKKILTEGKLERYIEELTARYPDKFLDMLRKDLRSEKEFLGAIQELEIDESAIENDLEEEAQTYIDEVRGMEPAGRETEEDF
jgi:hypothetical protein